MPAEQHGDVTDVILIQSGSATLQLGGELVEPTGTGGELRAPSIRGGETFPARTGDIFNIPPNVPHQMLLKPGESVSFLNVKVKHAAHSAEPADHVGRH